MDRRVRNNNIDEHNNTAANNNNSNLSQSQAQDEETTNAIRCDSPVIARLGPVVNCSNSNSSTGDALEVTMNNNNYTNNSGTTTGSSNLNRRGRCGKTSNVDLRSHPAQNQRFPLPEQIEDCPSSGDEGVVSPRKRIKMDYHHHHSNASAVSLLEYISPNVS